MSDVKFSTASTGTLTCVTTFPATPKLFETVRLIANGQEYRMDFAFFSGRRLIVELLPTTEGADENQT